MQQRIQDHGARLLAIFPNATEKDPVKLCKKLRRLELIAEKAALDLCNIPDYQERADVIFHDVRRKVSAVLGNVLDCQPKTGASCACRRGLQRDNCPNCEGTGLVIDFAKIRATKVFVPIVVNRDPRGYALKIDESVMNALKLDLQKDMGGDGVIAPDLSND